jgi:hypothetical protein
MTRRVVVAAVLVLAVVGVGLALLLTGIRYRVVGRENVPPGAVVYCSNHESNVDPGVHHVRIADAKINQRPSVRTGRR